MLYGYYAYTDHSIGLKIIILAALAIIADLYVYYGLRKLYNFHLKKTLSLWWRIFLFGGTIAMLLLLLFFYLRGGAHLENPTRSRYYYYVISVFFVVYLPRAVFCIFIIMHDLLSFIRYSYSKISRSELISSYIVRKTFLKAGLTAFVLMMLLNVYGTFWGRFNYQVQTLEFEHPDIPPAFSGYKIIQISDIHLGSYKNPKAFSRAIDKINALDPDLIVCTGDWVNYEGSEARPFVNDFKRLSKKALKLTVLGNHDFGDYVPAYDQPQKDSSVAHLMASLEKMGFTVLANSSVSIESNHEKIEILGVHNSNESHYINHGDLAKALESCDTSAFKILLSHNPEHWDWQVVNNRVQIQLMLAGHTHGAQFGIRKGKIALSPVSKLYKEWGGLYKKNNRYLYVNVGLGSIGFLGRIGMRPEITEIILQTKYE